MKFVLKKLKDDNEYDNFDMIEIIADISDLDQALNVFAVFLRASGFTYINKLYTEDYGDTNE